MTCLRTQHALVLWGLCCLAFATGRGFAAQRALPRGVVEIPGTNVQSLVALTDGTLLGNNGRVSRDGGRTWPEVRSFGAAGGAGIMRLLSGKLALVDSVGYASGTMWLSADEGKTWAKAGPIRVPGGPVFELGDTMIQLKQGPHKGRLLYNWELDAAGEHPGMEYSTVQARGRWKGHDYAVEGHGHLPEFYGSGFSWSDDEGKSWNYAAFQNMPNILMGWFDFHGEVNGTCGVTPAGEASLAETRDGRILFFGRSTVGRIVQSFSSDSGERWLALRPAPWRRRPRHPGCVASPARATCSAYGTRCRPRRSAAASGGAVFPPPFRATAGPPGRTSRRSSAVKAWRTRHA